MKYKKEIEDEEKGHEHYESMAKRTPKYKRTLKEMAEDEEKHEKNLKRMAKSKALKRKTR